MEYIKIDDTKLKIRREIEVPKEQLIQKKAMLESELLEINKALKVFE